MKTSSLHLYFSYATFSTFIVFGIEHALRSATLHSLKYLRNTMELDDKR